jgi:tartrate-resistant acid phosphatase type 5
MSVGSPTRLGFTASGSYVMRRLQGLQAIGGPALIFSILTLALLLVGSGGQGGGFGASACSADHPGFPVRKPETPAPGVLRFAVIGDFGSGSTHEAAVANLVKNWNPDFIVAVGDDRYGDRDYDAAVGQFYCDYLKDAGAGAYCSGGTSAVNRFFAALGNHDYSDGRGLAEYLNYFTLPGSGVPAGSRMGQERYYDFIQGPVHFFVIDSMGALDSGADMAAQKKWLKAGLAASPTPWQLVLLHHAPYSSGIHGSTVAMQWSYQAWGADAVLAGHDHDYERLQVGKIPYFVNGLGGMSRYPFLMSLAESQARYSADYGAMLVTASQSEITYDFISRTGTVIDSYTQSRLPSPATPQSLSIATPTAVSTSIEPSRVSPAPGPGTTPRPTPSTRWTSPY